MTTMNLYRVKDGVAIHIVVTTGELEAICLAEAGFKDDRGGFQPSLDAEVTLIPPDELVTIREEYGCRGDWVATERTAAEWASDGEGCIASTEW